MEIWKLFFLTFETKFFKKIVKIITGDKKSTAKIFYHCTILKLKKKFSNLYLFSIPYNDGKILLFLRQGIVFLNFI